MRMLVVDVLALALYIVVSLPALTGVGPHEWLGLGVGLVLLFALIEVLRNILEPRIVGNQIGLHPIVTITAMYAGLKIAGFWGMLAAPVAVLLGRYLWTGAAPERRAEA